MIADGMYGRVTSTINNKISLPVNENCGQYKQQTTR